MKMNSKVVGCEDIGLMKLAKGSVQQYSIRFFLLITPYSHTFENYSLHVFNHAVYISLYVSLFFQIYVRLGHGPSFFF